MKYIHVVSIIILVAFSSCKKETPLPLEGKNNFNIDNALQSLKKEQKLLIYFNAYSCINCRRIEETVLKNKKVRRLISENYSWVVLYVDDKQKIQNPENRRDLLGNIITTTGQLNVDHQTQLSGTGTQPTFAIINADGDLEKQIFHTTDIKEFIEILEEKQK